jgi:hypothetical protein
VGTQHCAFDAPCSVENDTQVQVVTEPAVPLGAHLRRGQDPNCTEEMVCAAHGVARMGGGGVDPPV